MKIKLNLKLLEGLTSNDLYTITISKYWSTILKEKSHTGMVVCPASSIMHTSNFLFASNGWFMPKQVDPTTLTWFILCLRSSRVQLVFIAVTNVRGEIYYMWNKERNLKKIAEMQCKWTWKTVILYFLVNCLVSSNANKINALHIWNKISQKMNRRQDLTSHEIRKGSKSKNHLKTKMQSHYCL